MADIALTAANIRALTENGAITAMFKAGGALGIGDVVYLAADGDVEEADANVSNTVGRGIGIVVAGPSDSTTIAAGDPVTVCIFGPVEGWSGATPGNSVFVSNTAGRLADAAGTVSHVMGRVISATRIWISPSYALSASG
jgi:hypothetical protein